MEEEKIYCITKKELEENDVDNGYMFCEDCHRMHFIEYRELEALNEESGVTRWCSLGAYRCKDQVHLWSIDGKRID